MTIESARLGVAYRRAKMSPPMPWSPGWIIAFLVVMFACQIGIAFGPFIESRTLLRGVAYCFSLFLLVLIRGDRPQHPSATAAKVVMLIIGVALVHPDTSGWVPGVVHAALYLAILAPVLWIPQLRLDLPALRRAVVVMWAFHSLSAALGVFQVYSPGTLDPNLSPVIDRDVASASTITTATGEVVYRAMGLSDVPGAAGVSGFYAVIIGMALFVTDRRLLPRVVYLVTMVAALTSIYLAQLRSHLVIAALVIVGFIAFLALRRGRRALLALVIVGAALAISFNIAVIVGGPQVFERVATLADEPPQRIYYANRGMFLEETFTEHLPQYPFGAGLARWGMASHYFASDAAHARSPSIWVEIQWTGWILDGGIPLMLAYVWTVAAAIATAVRLGLRADAASPLLVWAALVAAYDVGAMALTFSYPLFIGEFGLQFWILNGLLFAASSAESRRRHPHTAPAARAGRAEHFPERGRA